MTEAEYRLGYERGEANHQNDWANALDDLLPDDVEAWPSQVAAYIQRLQCDLNLQDTNPPKGKS